jgi:hypothetical protein
MLHARLTYENYLSYVVFETDQNICISPFFTKGLLALTSEIDHDRVAMGLPPFMYTVLW